MARNLVVCLDGTGNEIKSNLSNVLKLYVCLEKDEGQLVYYDPGVGTIGKPGWWSELRQQASGVLGLALGVGMDDNILDAYGWLCRTWRDGDRIYLLGFSRGAYTARALAGFVHMCGLLRPDQLNLCGYALVAYKRSADRDDLDIGSTFRRIVGARRPRFRFVGAWDTVASVIVPRADRFYLPSLQTLPYTRANPSVQVFRHAISLDERRRMFRLNHWRDPQTHEPDPYDRSQDRPQDIRQVWFAGVHADIGGGYGEPESGLSKYPLLWMVGEARDAGLRFDERLVRRLGEGTRPADARSEWDYVPPDPAAPLHRSLAGPWWLLEGVPKYYKFLEWPRRLLLFDLYLPFAEPRPVPDRPGPGARAPFFVHSSVLARMAAVPEYRPPNLPSDYEVEFRAGPQPPPARPAPRRGQDWLARLRAAFATWPAARAWLPLLGLVAALAIVSLLLHRLDLVPWSPNLDGLPAFALIAFLVPALAEETLFRGLLVRPPPDGASRLGPIAWSALLFTLWHPLQALIYDPPWDHLACEGWFLAGCAALGAACAWLFLATRSIWPPIFLHWLVVLGWKALYDAPIGAPAAMLKPILP